MPRRRHWISKFRRNPWLPPAAFPGKGTRPHWPPAPAFGPPVWCKIRPRRPSAPPPWNRPETALPNAAAAADGKKSSSSPSGPRETAKEHPPPRQGAAAYPGYRPCGARPSGIFQHTGQTLVLAYGDGHHLIHRNQTPAAPCEPLRCGCRGWGGGDGAAAEGLSSSDGCSSPDRPRPGAGRRDAIGPSRSLEC